MRRSRTIIEPIELTPVIGWSWSTSRKRWRLKATIRRPQSSTRVWLLQVPKPELRQALGELYSVMGDEDRAKPLFDAAEASYGVGAAG